MTMKAKQITKNDIGAILKSHSHQTNLEGFVSTPNLGELVDIIEGDNPERPEGWLVFRVYTTNSDDERVLIDVPIDPEATISREQNYGQG